MTQLIIAECFHSSSDTSIDEVITSVSNCLTQLKEIYANIPSDFEVVKVNGVYLDDLRLSYLKEINTVKCDKPLYWKQPPHNIIDDEISIRIDLLGGFGT